MVILVNGHIGHQTDFTPNSINVNLRYRYFPEKNRQKKKKLVQLPFLVYIFSLYQEHFHNHHRFYIPIKTNPDKKILQEVLLHKFRTNGRKGKKVNQSQNLQMQKHPMPRINLCKLFFINRLALLASFYFNARIELQILDSRNWAAFSAAAYISPCQLAAQAKQ